MTLGDLWAALQRFRLLAIGLFVAIFAIGIASIVLPAASYRSSSVVSVEPVGAGIGFETQQAIALIIPPTIARVTSPTFARSVRDRLEFRFRDAPITLSATNDPGTAIINLGVESSSPAAALNAARVAVLQLEPSSDRFKIAILSPPGPAVSVKAERAPSILGGTFVLGIIAAILAAAAAHRLRPRLPRAERFRDHYGHEILGEIPRRPNPSARPGAAALNGNGSAELIEAFRSLHARLTMRAGTRGGPDLNVSIAVTSWSTLEGKSTVVANLASTLAAHGRKVTVVDCDMRRPSVHRLLGTQLEPGLADLVAGKPVMSLLQSTDLPALDVIAAGQPQRHPAEIAQQTMPLLLSVLHDRTVLIDTPPMFAAETTVIAGEADFVLLVADFVERKPEEIEEALAELERTGTPVLGVVLNRVPMSDSRGRESYLYGAEAPAATPSKPRASA